MKVMSHKISQPPLMFFHFSEMGFNQANIFSLYTKKRMVRTMVRMPTIHDAAICKGVILFIVSAVLCNCLHVLSAVSLVLPRKLEPLLLRVNDGLARRRAHGIWGFEVDIIGLLGGETGRARARAVVS